MEHPYPTGPTTHPAPARFSPSPSAGRAGLIAVVATTALIAAGLGAAVGAIVIKSTLPNEVVPQAVQATNDAGASAHGDTHAQDIAVCSKYAIINATIPNPDTRGMDLLPAAAALENALAENPHASESVQRAVRGVIDTFYSAMADYGKVRPRGLAEVPPKYEPEDAGAAYQQAWTVCGLDQ